MCKLGTAAAAAAAAAATSRRGAARGSTAVPFVAPSDGRLGVCTRTAPVGTGL